MRKTIKGTVYDTAAAEELSSTDVSGPTEILYLCERAGYFLVSKKMQFLRGRVWEDAPCWLDDDAGAEAARGFPMRVVEYVRPLSEAEALRWCVDRLIPEPLCDLLEDWPACAGQREG